MTTVLLNTDTAQRNGRFFFNLSRDAVNGLNQAQRVHAENLSILGDMPEADDGLMLALSSLEIEAARGDAIHMQNMSARFYAIARRGLGLES